MATPVTSLPAPASPAPVAPASPASPVVSRTAAASRGALGTLGSSQLSTLVSGLMGRVSAWWADKTTSDKVVIVAFIAFMVLVSVCTAGMSLAPSIFVAGMVANAIGASAAAVAAIGAVSAVLEVGIACYRARKPKPKAPLPAPPLPAPSSPAHPLLSPRRRGPPVGKESGEVEMEPSFEGDPASVVVGLQEAPRTTDRQLVEVNNLAPVAPDSAPLSGRVSPAPASSVLVPMPEPLPAPPSFASVADCHNVTPLPFVPVAADPPLPQVETVPRPGPTPALPRRVPVLPPLNLGSPVPPSVSPTPDQPQPAPVATPPLPSQGRLLHGVSKRSRPLHPAMEEPQQLYRRLLQQRKQRRALEVEKQWEKKPPGGVVLRRVKNVGQACGAIACMNMIICNPKGLKSKFATLLTREAESDLNKLRTNRIKCRHPVLNYIFQYQLNRPSANELSQSVPESIMQQYKNRGDAQSLMQSMAAEVHLPYIQYLPGGSGSITDVASQWHTQYKSQSIIVENNVYGLGQGPKCTFEIELNDGRYQLRSFVYFAAGHYTFYRQVDDGRWQIADDDKPIKTIESDVALERLQSGGVLLNYDFIPTAGR